MGSSVRVDGWDGGAFDTLPSRPRRLSLGWGVAEWAMRWLTQPNGPHAGEPWRPTPRQLRFLTWFYAVDERGEFIFRHACRRLAKSSGKTPVAAAIALAELCGPVRFDGFDESAPGGVRGKAPVMPLVQVVATSERQTMNTMRMVRAFAGPDTLLRREYGLRPKKTFIEAPGGGVLQQVTSSAHTLEGGEVSAAICDETEHWVPALNGPEVMATVKQNAAKVPGSRVMETSNAWFPGAGSVAEESYERYLLQEAGQVRGEASLMLYDAVIGRENVCLTDEPEEGQVGITEELERIYADCPWVDIKQIRAQIWDTTYPESRSRRFFLNQPVVSEDQWVQAAAWDGLCEPRETRRGEPIVAFFDGSRYDDHTALVGCSLLDGYVFVLGHWKPSGQAHVIDQGKVCEAVRAMFQEYDVWSFNCDVREWENYVVTVWPDQYGERVHLPASRHGVFSWDMRTRYREFAEGVEAARTEIVTSAFKHDGNGQLRQHVLNCREREYRGRVAVNKDRPNSPNKIDLAVCMIGARIAYRQAVNSREWQERSSKAEAWM